MVTIETTHAELEQIDRRLRAVESKLSVGGRLHEVAALSEQGLPDDAIALSVADVAYLMNKSERTIRRYLEFGVLQPSGEQRSPIITLAEVRRWLRDTKEARA